MIYIYIYIYILWLLDDEDISNVGHHRQRHIAASGRESQTGRGESPPSGVALSLTDRVYHFQGYQAVSGEPLY